MCHEFTCRFRTSDQFEGKIVLEPGLYATLDSVILNFVVKYLLELSYF